jgi:hypothetical protein
MPRARTLVLVTLLAAPHSVCVAQLRESITFDRARIEAAGWSRITELLEAATGWTRVSVDGFTFAASPDRLPAAGLSAAGMPEWALYINGRPSTTNVLGAHLLELLPVTVTQVDSVVVIPGPAFVYGTLAPRGAIEVFTSPPKSGAFASASYQHGDETGDPGPYRYTDLSSPNVEKIGPFAQARAGFSAGRWSIDAAGHFASINITDTLLTTRFLSTGFGRLPPQVSAAGASARANASLAGGYHELVVSYARQRGLFFVPALQQAQASEVRAPSASVGGGLRVAGLFVDYSAVASSVAVDSLDSPLPFTIGHTRRLLEARGSISDTVGGALVRLSGGAMNWDLARGSSRTNRSAVTAGAGIAGSTGRVRGAAEVDVGHSSESTGGGASVEATLAIDSAHAVGLRVAAMRSVPEVDGSWIDHALVSPAVPLHVPLFSTAELNGVISASGLIRVNGALFAERVTDWQLDSVSSGPSHAATFAGARIRFATAPARVRAQVAYSITTPVASDDAIRTAIESTARNELRVDLVGNVSDDLAAGLAIALADGTTWPDAAANTPTTPPLRRVDVSLEKWGWHRRLHVELVVRNALDAPERYHPLGAQWNMRAHVSAGITLP